MKTTTYISGIFSPKSKWILGLFLAGSLALASCKDNEDTTDAVTTDDAAEIVTGTVSSDSYGLVSTIDDASTTAESKGVYTETPTISCGQTYENNFSQAQVTNYYSYNYNINDSYLLQCSTLGIPQTFTYTHNMTGTYSTARLGSNDSANSNLVISGISPQSQNITVNGSYDRNGTQTFKTHSKNMESTVNMTLANLSVNKSTQTIISGTGTVSIEAKSDNKKYTFTGSITFNGNETATLIINGISYTINL